MVAKPASRPPDDDFVRLLARVRLGDESAADELVRRYEKAVLRCVRSRLSRTLRGAMDSMDVMQSVHRSLLIGLKSERFQMTSPQQLIGLAVVMVQRKVARHWRKEKRMPTTCNATDLAGDVVPCIENVPATDSTPSDVAAASDLLDRLLSQLNDLDRQLVQLKLDGYNSVDAAEILHREPAFVRMRWSRLRQMLREQGYLDR
jgi:RNA polymerase sigma factor (sigma-70 family)